MLPAGLYEALKFMGIDNVDVESVCGVSGMPVLIGGGSDGAAMNVADGRLKGMIQHTLLGFTGHSAMHIDSN